MTDNNHELFKNQFYTYEEFKNCLDSFIKVTFLTLINYLKQSGYTYRIDKSVKFKQGYYNDINEKLIYKYIKFICPHGEKFENKKKLIKPISTLSKGCLAFIIISYKNDLLYVLKYNLVHNHAKHDINLYKHNQVVLNKFKDKLSSVFDLGANNIKVKERLKKI